MKHFQLLTFVLAVLPYNIALVLHSEISSTSSTSSTSSHSLGLSNSSSTSSYSSSSSSSSRLILSSETSSPSNGAPRQPTTSPAFPGGPTSSPQSSPSSSEVAPTNSTTSSRAGRFSTSSTVQLGTAAGSQSTSLVSSGTPLFPTASTTRPFASNTAYSSGAPISPTQPSHGSSSVSGLPPNSHTSYAGTGDAYKSSGIPVATGSGGVSTRASGIFQPSGTGKIRASNGASGSIDIAGTKGIFPSSGTGQGSLGGSGSRGIFPSSGTGLGSASGTGIPKGILSSNGSGQIRGTGTGISSGIFPPSGTNPKLTASGGANSSVPTRAASCGLCDVIIPQVQVQYFASNSNKNATCTQSPGGGAAVTPPPAPALVKRRLARRNGTFEEGIVVSDDYTFTSPSMYVVMSQGIQVTDNCGIIGSSIASAVVPVSDISTISYNIPVGAVLSDAVITASTYTKPMKAEDLACPTWGISGNWNPRPNSDPLEMPGGIDLNVPAAAAPGATSLAVITEVQDDTHVGAPWYPIIVLPHEVLGLDPLWGSCIGRLVNPSFPIFDPPHALEAETVIVPPTAAALAPVPIEVAGGFQPDVANGDLSLVAVSGNNGGEGNALVKVPASALVAGSPLVLAPPVPTATIQQPAVAAAPANVPAPTPTSPLADTSSPLPAVPAANPPAANPPAANPPAANPPAANPPAANPSAANPPITNPPVANPPAANPPAQNQGFLQSLSAALAVSTVNVIPVEAANSPAPNVPAANLPAANPPAANPPAANPPVVNTPVQANVANSPAQNLPAANQPAANPPAAVAPAPLSVGGQPVQQQGSTLVVAGQSIAPGSTGIVAGHQVVNAGSDVAVDGSSQAIQPNPTPAPAPLPSVDGQQIQQQGSNLVVAGQTIAPGSSAAVAGHSVVNNGDNVVVDGTPQAIQPTPAPVLVAGSFGGAAAPEGAAPGGVAPAFQGVLPASAAAPLPTVGGQQIQQQGSNLVVAGQTVAPGSSASVAGHQVANNGNAVVVDGSSQALPPAGSTPAPAALPAITIGGTPYTADNSGNFVVNGQTLNANSPITVAGTPVSILPGSSAVAIGSVTQAIAQPAAGPTSPPVISVGGTPYTADSSGNFIIGGQTLNPSNPITVSGTPISILPGNTAVAIGSSTQAIVTPPATANNANSPAQGQPPLTVGGSTYYPTGPSSAYVLPGGQTLTPGAQITVAGTPVSLAPDGSTAVVGGTTENLAPTITPAPGQPILTFGGTTYRPTGPSSAYVIGGQTLTPGAGPITVSGTQISLAANGVTAVVGSSTENLQAPITSQAGLTFGGTTYQPTSVPGASSAYIIQGQTITPGAAPVTVSGTAISVAANGASAVVGGITEDLGASATPEPAITFDGSTYHPITGEPSDYVVGSQTLTPGGVITVSGTPISLATNGASAIIGSSTQNLQMTQPPLVIGGSSYYATGPSSDYVINGQTITPGASVTIGGTPISLASNGASAVVGTSTEDLLPSLTAGAVLTVGGVAITPNPTAFVVNGRTMSVGASAIISGTPVALESGGTLMVGTSAIPLATASGTTASPISPTASPLTGSAAEARRVPWTGLAMGFIGTGFLYIL